MVALSPELTAPLLDGVESLDDIRTLYRSTGDFTLAEQSRRYALANQSQISVYRHQVAGVPGFAADSDCEVALWRYLDLALNTLHGDGYKWRPQWQKRGTCVGQAGKLATDYVMAVNHVAGDVEFLGRAAVCAQYAGSRVEVGRRPARWDGSTGFWLAKWLTDWGVVLLRDLELPDDSRDPDESAGVRWAASRSGVPTELEQVAKTKPITRSHVSTSADEVCHGLSTGCPTVTCSPLIATGRRGKYGISPLERVGGHAQVISASFLTPDRGRVFTQQNSWNHTFGTGERWPADLPPGAVNITERDLERQLAAGDSHTFEGITGLDPLPAGDLRL